MPIKQPKFSIIVPIHNSERYLEQCLTSLVNQTFDDIEILCVVNGSSDSSEEIVKRFVLIDSRVTCFVLEKAGLSSARNYGIKKAKGEYIAFVDADDWVDENLFVCVNRKLEQYPVDCLIHSFWKVKGKRYISNKGLELFYNLVGDAPFLFPMHEEACINITAVCWNKVIRRDLLLRNEIYFGENLKCAEDTAFTLELYHKCKELVFLNKELYFYRYRPAGASVTTKADLTEIINAADYCLERLRNDLNNKRKTLILSKFLKTLLYTYRRKGQPLDDISLATIEYQYRRIPFWYRWAKQGEIKNVREMLLGYKMMKLMNKCFSITKTERYKFIKLFGFEFKFTRSSYRRLSEKRKELSNRYLALLESLKKREEKKYRVGFLVGHIQKWKCQTVFDLMLREPSLEPLIVIVPVFKKGESIEIVESRLNEIKEYCRSKNMDHVVAWDENLKDAVALDSLNLDVVFYEQPWGINKKYKIAELSKRSLTYYVPYYVPNYGNLDYDCKAFHQQLFRYYVFNQSWKDLYLTRMEGSEGNLLPVGHPILDFYLENKSVKNKEYVIFAPHHSLSSDSIGYGTFDWSGFAILKFAQMHPEFNWVYKPHPNTKKELVKNNIMTPEEVEGYWKAWEEVGEVYEGGEYLPLFNDSKCLITDCGSFLVEYFYTGKPVIHLISGRAEEPVSAFKEIIDCYYKVTTKAGLESQMEELLINKKDPLAQQRRIKFEDLTLSQESCASKIVQDIKNTLSI